MAAEKPPKPKVRYQYADNISELQDDEDIMVIGRDSFDSNDLASGVRNLASQPDKTRSPWEVHGKIIGYEENPQKAAHKYREIFKTEPNADLRYVYKIRADLHQAHLHDPTQWPEDNINHKIYLKFHPSAITSPDYDGPSQLPLGADVVCRYKNNARREGLYIVRVDDTDANAGATSSDFIHDATNKAANSISGLFNEGVSSVKSFFGMEEKSTFRTPKELKLTPAQENELGTAVRKLLLPDAVRFGSKYGTRIHPVTKSKSNHRGCDFSCGGKSGAAIVSPKPGVIKRSFARWTKSYNGAPYLKLGGNQVVVDHQDGTKSYFLHLEKVDVALNQEVKAGQKIGTMGNTGAGTGPHLHYGIKDQGVFVDPIPLLMSWFNGGAQA